MSAGHAQTRSSGPRAGRSYRVIATSRRWVLTGGRAGFECMTRRDFEEPVCQLEPLKPRRRYVRVTAKRAVIGFWIVAELLLYDEVDHGG